MMETVAISLVRNNNLHEALKNYAQAAIRRVDELLRAGTPRVFWPSTSWVPSQQGILERTESEEPQWFVFLTKYGKPLEELPEYKAAIRALREDDSVRRQVDVLVGTGAQRRALSAPDVLNFLVSRILLKSAPMNLDVTAFEREYARIEDSLFASKIKLEIVAPLAAFDAERDAIVLQDGIRIERLSQEELDSCVRHGLVGQLGMMENIILHPPKFAIKLNYNQEKVIGDGSADDEGNAAFLEEAEAVERVDDVVKALRLFKDGNVSLAGMIHSPVDWIFAETFSRGGPPATPRWWPTGYTLHAHEIEALAVFWKALQNDGVRSRKSLGVAMRRLSYADERHRAEDQLLDLMIAAEALFLGGKDEGEKQYQLSMRAARFLGTDVGERKAIFSHMKAAYRARSKIVHGGTPRTPDGFLSFPQFVQKIEAYLRKGLVKAVGLAGSSESTKDIIDWDELALS